MHEISELQCKEKLKCVLNQFDLIRQGATCFNEQLNVKGLKQQDCLETNYIQQYIFVKVEEPIVKQDENTFEMFVAFQNNL